MANDEPKTEVEKLSPASQAKGNTGVLIWGGHVINGERKPELSGRALFTTYDNLISNTTIVAAAIRYFQSLIGGTGWTITPREDAGKDGERAADIVRQGLIECAMQLPWSAILKKAALFKYYGFSIHEWTMRRRGDGMIVYKSIEHRPQHTIWRWDMPDGGGQLDGVYQLSPGMPEVYIPRSRIWYCVDNTLTDSPNGVGLLRHITEKGERLKRYEQLEGFGFEGDLRGMPVGRIPGAELMKLAAEQADPQAWFSDQVAAVTNLVRNHIRSPYQGIVLDSSVWDTATLGSQTPTFSNSRKWDIDIIKSSGAHGLSEMHQVVERLNREIARVLGMEFLLLGGDGKGSLALSKDKTSTFAAVLEATLGELSWFVMHDLVYPLLEMNGLDPEKVAPQLNPDPIATERIEVVVDSLMKLAQAGAVLMPDDPAIDQIRQRLHIAKQPKLTPDLMAAMVAQRTGTANPNAPTGSEAPTAAKPGNGSTKPADNGGNVQNEQRPNGSPERQQARSLSKLFRHVDQILGEEEE